MEQRELSYSWGNKSVQSLWKTVEQCLPKLNTQYPGPAIPLLGLHHREVTTSSYLKPHKRVCRSLTRNTEQAMATHSSVLVWRIPGTEEPGRLQSMGSQRVGHDWATSLSLLTFMHWRGKWQLTPVFLPGESQGWRSLVGCRLWGRTESDTT